MPYLSDLRATSKRGSTNPQYPLDLLESIQGEFTKGLNGGIFDATYVLSKLETLTRHVQWLENEARKEWDADLASAD